MRLIDGDEVYGILREAYTDACTAGNYDGAYDLRRCLVKLGTLPEAVVRCKDCDNRVYINMGDEIGVVGGCAIYGAALPEDFYCAYGKREVIE